MKRIFLLLFLAVFAVQASGQGVNFRDLTPDEAVAAAKAENKYVFVDVYTNWCGPCKMMDAQVFPLKEMGDYFNAKYVSIKQNAEVGEVGPAFANKFGVKAYPTFIVLDGEGDLVHMFAGGTLDLTFIDKVEQAFDPAKAFGALRERYDAGERDPRFVASYLESLQNTHTADMNKLVDEFYAATSDEDKINAESLFMFDNYAAVGSEKDEFLTKHRDRFREAAGRDRVDGVFKNKYMAWYSQVLMGYNRATVEDIEKTDARLASLGIADMAFFPVLQAAAVTKVTGEGAGDIFGMVKAAAPALSDNDRNLMLYFITIGLKDLFDQEQKDELVGLVNNDNTKGYIIRSITPRQ